MRRAASLALVGVAVYLAFLVALVPARDVYGWLALRLHGVALGGVDGSLWSGRTARVIVNGRNFGTAQWRLHPAMLLLGRLEYQVRWSGQMGAGRGLVGYGVLRGSYLRRLQAELSASRLAAVLGASLPVSVGGALHADLKSVRFSAGRPTAASGLVTWKHAQLIEPIAVELGGLAVRLHSAKGGTQGVLSSQGGPLQVHGQVSLAGDGHYLLRATLKPTGAHAGKLRSALQYLGPPDAQGRYSLVWSGVL